MSRAQATADVPSGRVVHFLVHGIPATKGSFRAVNDKNSGRAIMKPHMPGTAKWAARVAAVAENHAPEPRLGGPLSAQLLFWMQRPESAPKRRRTWPLGRTSDLDKLARNVLDALTGPVFADDGQIVLLVLQKDYSSEMFGVEITVAEIVGSGVEGHWA